MGEFVPDFVNVFNGINPNLPTILLTHQPRSLKYLERDVDLVICGHTHGGQIFPFSLLVWLNQKYVYGLYNINNNMQLYVSSGAGLWGPPFRVLTNSEIVYFEKRLILLYNQPVNECLLSSLGKFICLYISNCCLICFLTAPTDKIKILK